MIRPVNRARLIGRSIAGRTVQALVGAANPKGQVALPIRISYEMEGAQKRKRRAAMDSAYDLPKSLATPQAALR
jgi:hypothetical protein